MTRPVALVTGGLRGIGFACAEALAGTGFDIFIADLAEHPHQQIETALAKHGARFAYGRCDIADVASHEMTVDDCLARLGGIDCLVNNAGVGAVVRGDMLSIAPENFDRVMGINLRGTVFLTNTVARAMLQTRSDHARSIVTVTSVSAEMVSAERADYCVSKAALSMWVKNLAVRLAPENVGVFEVRPGIIRTDMTAAVADKYDRLIAAGLVPSARWGEAGDVAAAVAALASGKLGFATGTVVNVDGALSTPRL
jgi:NAD(P)-dependent dehydrogenase (short-subunit alcohol dehydrogenase family)